VHPAYSVIAFTVASGAGYGLLGCLAALALLGRLPAAPGFAWTALGLAFVLATAGLLSSTLHLGHPERAWRAFSQWRSSWLSREGVAALAGYVPAGLFALGWLFLSEPEGGFAVLHPAFIGAAAVALALCLVTVFCTAMIYASLKPIQRWHNGWVAPAYLMFAAMSGVLWLTALMIGFGVGQRAVLWLAAALIALAGAVKLGYWRFIDRTASASTAASATGLGHLGAVRLLDPPHTEENYLLREMGYRLARKHAAKLRRLAFLMGFALPLVLTLVAAAVVQPWAAIAAGAAAFLATAGLVIERWLFFAEAKHAVTLYYGADRA